MKKSKKIIKNARIIILVVALLFAIISISPQFGDSSVSIRNVVSNSSANNAGIKNPTANERLTVREKILSINTQPITTIEDYYAIVSDVEVGDVLSIATDRSLYKVIIKPLTITHLLNETEEKLVNETVLVNKTINGTVQQVEEIVEKTITVQKTEVEIIGVEDLGLRVFDSPRTNIQKGLDLTGGTRVLLQPEEEILPDDVDFLIDNMKERLNVFGLTDLVIRESVDLEGNQFILVEIAGANEEEVKDLLGQQGKFEAKIGNTTVFQGGKDITYVARSADKAGLDPRFGCQQVSSGGWTCRFRFSISLTPKAAQAQADASKDLPVVVEDGRNDYLATPLSLFLDDALVDELNIAADLKGRAVTDIQISGSGNGATRQEAVLDTLKNMKRLQTVLITGSLPVKLDIVQTNTLSPALGDEFVKNTLLMGLLAIGAVILVLTLRYKKPIIIIPSAIAMLSEVTLLLGLASLIGWNLDLAAIAGIIIAVGTGVDDQIVITDEILKRETQTTQFTWKQKIKRAFFIIMAAYFTTVVAMLPLWFAGAGLLKGFALTTIFGVTFGVFITRPAYAAMMEILLEK